MLLFGGAFGKAAARTAAAPALWVRSMGTTYKTSTGLVGLAVDKNGRETLIDLSAQVLESVKVCRRRYEGGARSPQTAGGMTQLEILTTFSFPPSLPSNTENTTGKPVPRGRGEVVQLLY